MPRLVIKKGTEIGKAFELTGPEVVIGRHPQVSVFVDGARVSRRHARITRDPGGGWRLEDLGSSNGTFLNGKKLAAPEALNGGDELLIGTYLFGFEDDEDWHGITINATTAADTTNNNLYVGDAARKLKVILQLAAELSRTLQVEDLLTRALDQLLSLFPQADRGLVIFLEAGRPCVRAQRQRIPNPEAPRFSTSIVHKVVSESVGIFAEDLATDDRFAESHSIAGLDIRSFICVPLATRGRQTLGVLQLEGNGRGGRFKEGDLQLLTVIGLQIAVVVDNAQLHRELIGRQRIEQEVALAREIQLGYLPSQEPDLPLKNFELHAELLPAQEISGDFYDYFNLGPDRLAIVVADVCGKGIPAALFMSTVRALLRNLAELERDPGIILRQLNNAVARQNPKCQFVTLSLGVFDPASRTLEIASAGHPPPLVRRRSGAVEVLSVAHGPLLGIAERAEPYPKLTCQLHPDEVLLLFTDGVTEAPAPDQTMYGLARLKAALGVVPFPNELKQWSDSFWKSLHGFTRSPQHEDDITLVLLRVR